MDLGKLKNALTELHNEVLDMCEISYILQDDMDALELITKLQTYIKDNQDRFTSCTK